MALNYYAAVYADHSLYMSDELFHVLVVLDGGWLMDSELAVACTGQREYTWNILDVHKIKPNCLACWSVVCTMPGSSSP